jgi:CHRD domain/PEP-CTERM motif
MKRKIAPGVVAVLVCLMSSPSSAAVTVFATTLSSIGEPVPTSLATGAATVSFDDVLFKVSVQLSYAGIANSSPFGHIHCCTAVAGTGNASVALGFNTLPAATSGNYSDSFTLAPAAFASLLAGVSAGKAYVNVHTPGTYAAGEIRGFLAAVPEPASWTMLLAGFGMAGMAIRRRRETSLAAA